MSRFDEIRELTRARFVLFVREPEAIFWVFVFPLVLASVLGFAFRSAGVSPVKIAVVEGDGASALVAALEPDEHIEIETYTTRDEAYMKLTRAAVDGMVEPGDPPTLTFDVARAEAATAELRVRRMLALAIDPGSEAPLVIEPVTETGSRYVDFLFPGLIGMMRHSSFFLSFMLSRLVFLVIELIVLVGFAALVLGVPFNGNIFAFAIVAVIGAATFAGIGILVASRARTIEAVSGMMNLVMMPMWLASGVFFSYEKFPDAIHPLLKLLPLTALNDGLRAVMLDGDPLVSQLPELAVLLGWCAVTFVVGGRIFRWE
ncbi:MAG: ABC transporter permease [Planctomycetota bacterium]|jgi:ABC-type polysaccharide/polyol phosphate export permease